jgi:hypothetical protein
VACFRDSWGTFEDRVGVRSTESKRADGNVASIAPQHLTLGRDAQGAVAPVSDRVASSEMETRWYLPVSQHEDRLEESGYPRRRFEVTNIGLQGAHPQRIL